MSYESHPTFLPTRRTLAVLAAGGLGLLAALPVRAGITPIGQPVRVSETFFAADLDPQACSRAGGGYFVLWRDESPPGSLRVTLLDPAPAPAGEPIRVNPPGSRAFSSDLACLADGGALALWAEPGAPSDSFTSRILARRLDPSGRPIGDPVPISDTSGSNRTPGLDCGPGFCVASWTRFEPDRVVAGARLLAPSGDPLGPEIVIAGTAPTFHEAVVAIHPGGGFVAVTSERGGPDVFARRYDATGSPVGHAFLVAEPERPDGEIFSPAATLGPDGSLFVVWEERDPTTLGRVHGVVLDPAGDPVRPPFRLDRSTTYHPFYPRAAVDRTGAFFTLWQGTDSVTPNRIFARGFGRRGLPARPAQVLTLGGHPTGFDLAAHVDGTFLVVWSELDRVEPGRFVAALLARSADPPPPPGAWLGSPEVPGFQVKVRITGGGGEPLEGALETECAAETICVSGAVAGRAEVFVRVVGPKPNGRLWPEVIKFSTSTVEVWIEQVSTGEIRYYRLEGAAPGKDDLTGLFDRAGFEP